MSADLVTWLRSCLDADAQRATGVNTDAIHVAVFRNPGCTTQEIVYVAHQTPEHTIRDVASKRAILDLHSPSGITSGPPYKWACSVCHRRDGWWAGEYPCTTVRLLVAPFASRAGFDPSWLD